MSRYEKPDVIVVSAKGQVVTPQSIRERLGIRPKTKLLVYGFQDAVIMKKLKVPDIAKELEAMYKRIDEGIAKGLKSHAVFQLFSLAEKLEDSELRHLWRTANTLHQNFYENWMPPREVELSIRDVKTLIEKLKST
ncbi:hypothetical protein KEJ27_08000 [Candidatus Bathyarchaeota archaeon]|nr:hypothetical protein [Candidatus Bathyarchaeota archaeon]MBS7614037.1 hypothetical protein [Candidatus Bathyarchaeota archaeon]MBS7617388.1 hypothetical protein [Candidatus Bathyarchaeota archaeon]